MAFQYLFDERLCVADARRGGSWIGEAAVGGDKNNWLVLKHRHQEVAELLLNATSKYILAYINKLAMEIRSGSKVGIFVCRAVVLDEATKRLRVWTESQQAEFLSILDSEAASDEITLKRKRIGPTQLPVNDKVVYAEVDLSFGFYDVRTKMYSIQSFVVPQPLKHWDRSTAENALAVQMDILSIPGLTREFLLLWKRNLVLPTQDRCGANEKQVNQAMIEDRVDEQVPIDRLPSGCEIHRTATISTKTADLVATFVSGCIFAWDGWETYASIICYNDVRNNKNIGSLLCEVSALSQLK
jgi:hypothetical protein